MSAEEWESLCDGCGRCCLHKLEDEDTGDVFFTRVACRLLDIETCRCTQYGDRTRLVPDCLDLRLSPYKLHWLPSTCAYRLLSQGEELPEWHPLISGTPQSVIDAGLSVSTIAIPEGQAGDLEDHVDEELD